MVFGGYKLISTVNKCKKQKRNNTVRLNGPQVTKNSEDVVKQTTLILIISWRCFNVNIKVDNKILSWNLISG